MKKVFTFLLFFSIVSSALIMKREKSVASDISTSDNYTVQAALKRFHSIDKFNEVFNPKDFGDNQRLLSLPDGGFLLQKVNQKGPAGIEINHEGTRKEFTPNKDPNSATLAQVRSAILTRDEKK